MPRPSQRGQALEALDNAIENAILVYLIDDSSPSEEDEEELEDIEDLVVIRGFIASQR